MIRRKRHLDEVAVRAVREMLRTSGLSRARIAEAFLVKPSVVGAIADGKTYRWVPDG